MLGGLGFGVGVQFVLGCSEDCYGDLMLIQTRQGRDTLHGVFLEGFAEFI